MRLVPALIALLLTAGTLAMVMPTLVMPHRVEAPPQCLDCGHAWTPDPVLARRLRADTGLPICERAGILKEADRSSAGEPILEYSVTVDLQDCQQGLPAAIQARMDRTWQAIDVTAAGKHVLVSRAGLDRYSIDIWWAAPPRSRS